MLQVICGFVVGLLLAGLGFGLVGGGVPGLIVACLLYTSPSPRDTR